MSDAKLQTSPPPVGGDFETSSLFASVLLIEDEAAHAQLIERTLRGVVGEVTRARSGAEALQAIEKNLFELVLCDLHLPDISGIKLLRSIRLARPALPIIVMTSSSNLEHAVAAMREGAWDYTVKQFGPEFTESVKLVVTRTAQRKIQHMREVQLRAERDAFWTAVRTAQDGLAILDSGGRVTFANERFQDIAALIAASGGAEVSTGAVSAGDLIEMLALRDRAVAESLRELIHGNAQQKYWSSELEVTIPGPEKEARALYFEFAVNSVPIEGAAELAGGVAETGSFRRFVCWVRDITRRKEQERFQRDLLATTTHDLKGPLGAILTSAELIANASRIDEPRVQDLITRIGSCARNSITLIDEFLSARRIQDGVLVVKPAWQNARETVEDIILDFMPVARGKSITLESEQIDPDLEVYADKIGLNRVLGNLVSNAIKFTPRGGTVKIAADRIGAAVRIVVKDSGSGIDQKNQATLFERYSRLDEHRNIEGTGLGLFVTKNIVDAHHGRIEVTSEPGSGSAFAVYLPDPVRSGKESRAPSAAV